MNITADTTFYFRTMGTGVSSDAEFYVSDLLETCSVTTVAGAPGTGKTALILQLTNSLITGKDFCGLKVSRRAKVLWVQYDSTSNQFERYCTRYCPGVTFPALTLDGVKRINIADSIVDFKEVIKQMGVDVVVFDTLSTCVKSVDQNNNDEMTKVYENLIALANDGISSIVLHHMSKGEYGVSTNVRGASAITASTYNEWKLIETSTGVEFRITKSREVEKRTVCTLNIGYDSVSVVEAKNVHQQRLDTLLAKLKERGSMTRTEAQEAINVKHNVTAKPILDALALLPDVSKIKVGKADVYTYVGMKGDYETQI